MSAAPTSPSGRLDQNKLSEFFNELELTEDRSDLDLLVEAERRGLIDPVCAQLLAEARRRGWIAPKDSDKPVALYEVKYFGCSTVNAKGDFPTVDEVSAALSKITANPRMAFQQLLLLEVHASSTKCFDVSKDMEQESTRSKTLRRIKNLTLRTITGQKRDEDERLRKMDTTNAELIVEHSLSDLVTFLSFEKIVTVVTAEEDYMGHKQLLCHAYKCKDRRKALEITDHLRRTREGLTSREEEKSFKTSPIQRITLTRTRFGFGFNIVGPATSQEATTGVFISRIETGSVADKHPMVHVGQQIAAINGRDTEDCTMSEVRQLIMSSGDILVLDLRDNPYGWGMCQYKLGDLRPEVRFTGTQNTDNLDIAVDDVFQDFLRLSMDSDYTAPATIVSGKVQFQY